MSQRLSLSEIYNNPKTGFVGFQKLYETSKQYGYTSAQVKEFLKNNNISQMYFTKATKKQETIPIFGKRGHCQSDLTFYNQFKRQNSGYSIILIVIDVNSRKAYARALKNKDQNTVITALNDIIETDKANITCLQTDNGSEFKNKKMAEFCTKHNITQEFCQIDDKRCLGKGERFNKTIKGMLNRYMTANNTARWVDVLASAMENYNNSYHSAIKKAPNQMTVEDEKAQINHALDIAMKLKHDLKEGDYVRLPVEKNVFSKDGSNFSSEVYRISKVNKRTIKVENSDGKIQPKNYKVYEVLRVPKTENTPIEVIQKAKKTARVDRILSKEGVKEHQAIPRAKRVSALNSDIINRTLLFDELLHPS